MPFSIAEIQSNRTLRRSVFVGYLFAGGKKEKTQVIIPPDIPICQVEAGNFRLWEPGF